jgi:anti-anti-sigma factor
MVELLEIVTLESRRGLKLSGEVDISNVTQLADSLSRQVAEAEDLHLDLADLEFIDGAGVRVLVQAARRLPRGRRLVLWSAPNFVKRLLAVLKVDESSGLLVAG